MRGPRGFALPAVLFALLVLAGLVAGAFFAALQELRIGISAQREQRAFDAAESGLGATLGQWDATRLDALAPGDSAITSATLPSGSGTYTTAVYRLSDALFLIRAVGHDPAAASQRAVGAVARLEPAALDARAAAMVRGRLEIADQSLVDGADRIPPGWDCPAGAADTIAGAATPDSTLLDVHCTIGLCLRGQPRVLVMSSLTTDAALFAAAGLDWDALASQATIVLEDGVVGEPGPAGTAATCDARPFNWGEPARPAVVPSCVAYRPIVLARGDLTVAGGRGQGILLVEGDLAFGGGFEFRGMVAVRGRLSGAGGALWGAVLVGDRGDAGSTLRGRSELAHSVCAAGLALKSNAPARLLGRRGWAELF